MATPTNLQESSAIKCSNCQNAIANLWCKKCEDGYCSECYGSAHAAPPAMKKHESVPISQRPILCKQHPGQELIFWCNDCETIACRDCIILRHQGHKPIEITAVAPGKENEQRELFTKVEKELDQLLKQTAAKMMSSENVTIASITKTFDSMRSMITNYENELKEKIRSIDRRNRNLLEEFQNRLKQKEQEVKNCKTTFEGILKSKDHSKLLQDHKQAIDFLKKNIDELIKIKKPTTTAYSIQGMNGLQGAVTKMLQEVNIKEWQQAFQEFALPEACKPLGCEGRPCSMCHKCRDWQFTGDKATWDWIRSVKDWSGENLKRWKNDRLWEHFKQRDGATCYYYYHGYHGFVGVYCVCEDNIRP